MERRVRSWLGEGVQVRAAGLEARDFEALLPEEQAHVRRAVQKRQAEFATARVLARELLGAMGYEKMALVPRADRSPRWPDRVVGSITHSSEHCVVLCGKKDRWRSLGVDLERARAFSEGMVAMVMTPFERDALQSLSPAQAQARCVQSFCLKEAFYKFQSPLTGLFLDFQDVELTGVDGPDPKIRVAEQAHPRAEQAFAQLGEPRWQLHSEWLDPERVFAVVAQRAVGEAG